MTENKKSDNNYNDLNSSNANDIEGCKEICLDTSDYIAASYRVNDGASLG